MKQAIRVNDDNDEVEMGECVAFLIVISQSPAVIRDDQPDNWLISASFISLLQVPWPLGALVSLPTRTKAGIFR